MTVTVNGGSYDVSVYKERRHTETEHDKECDGQYYSDDEDVQQSGLCCLGGCLTGCAVAVMFFVILPAGILATVYATNNDSSAVLAVGIVLISVPVVTAPVLTVVYYSRQRVRKYRKRRVTSTQLEQRHST